MDYANLSGANLLQAKLPGAYLQKAIVTGAWLERANLSGAHFLDAKLCGARLMKADLSSGNFLDANLNKANISDANLSGVEFSIGGPETAKGLTQAQLDEARAETQDYGRDGRGCGLQGEAGNPESARAAENPHTPGAR